MVLTAASSVAASATGEANAQANSTAAIVGMDVRVCCRVSKRLRIGY
jgi:hypothetical protein